MRRLAERSRGIEDYDVNAAIARAVFVGVVGRGGMVLREAGGGKARGGDVVTDDEHLDELGGAGGREFPVRIEKFVVDRNVIGVAFDAQGFVPRQQNGGEAVDGAPETRHGWWRNRFRQCHRGAW